MSASNNSDIWCVIPVFNNADAILRVVEEARAQHPYVLVVDDGSTDADLSKVLTPTGATVIRHEVNRGKGAALLTAAHELGQRQAKWMITLDGDGQHSPSDLPAILALLKAAGDDHFVVIGQRDLSAAHIPEKSRFGMRFSDLWVRLETGVAAHDSQSGFRVYPVRHLNRLHIRAMRYNFEIEALVRLLWGGLELRHVPIHVWYPAAEERRVSHFRPVWDNARISLTHARLVIRRLLPWRHQRLVPKQSVLSMRAWTACLHPLRFIKLLIDSRVSPFELTVSAAVGIFLGTLPLVACHSLAIAYVTARLRMNQLMALSIQSLCAPPVVPVLCILLGYRMRNGQWLTDFAWIKTPSEYGNRLADWLIGSLVLAPLLAGLTAALVYFLARFVVRLHAISAAAPVQPGQRGNAFGIGCFKRLTQVCGLRGAYALLFPVCLYYALFDFRAIRSVQPYLRHRFPEHTFFARWLDTYRIFFEQGKMLIDRYAGISGVAHVEIDPCECKNHASCLVGQRGMVLLMSHVGNWQAAIPSIRHFGMPVNLLMMREANQSVTQVLKIDQDHGDVHILSADRFIEQAPRIVSALTGKEIVGLMGDRAYGTTTVAVPFLGETAYFPYSAFGIAASVGCPVLVMLVPRLRCGGYEIHTPMMVEPTYRPDVPRISQLTEWVRQYASALEVFSQEYPYQCFLYTDLWTPPPSRSATEG